MNRKNNSNNNNKQKETGGPGVHAGGGNGISMEAIGANAVEKQLGLGAEAVEGRWVGGVSGEDRN